MKWITAGCVVLCWAASVLSSPARIEVDCRFEHGRVMHYEPLIATVSVRNRTPRTVIISGQEGDAHLSFDVAYGGGRLAERTDHPMLREALVVEPHETIRFRIDLLPRYRILDQGPLTIAAVVALGDEIFVSNRTFVDVVPGMVLRQERFALSADDSASRLVGLRTLSRDRFERIFLRIDDEQRDLCLGVYELGSLIRIFPPQIEMDAADRVHVLHQSAPARYTHTVVTADGRLVDMVYYTPAGVRPRLEVGPDGQASVYGVRPFTGDPVVEPMRMDSRGRGVRPAP